MTILHLKFLSVNVNVNIFVRETSKLSYMFNISLFYSTGTVSV